MATIADREPRVTFSLGNRTDLQSRIFGWLKDTYTEFAMAYPFEELEDTIEDQLVASIGEYDYPEEARAIKAVTVVFSDGSTRRLRRKHIRNIERYSTNSDSRPAIYAPFSDQIHVRPVPDTSETFRWRIWKKPVIEDPLEDTVIELPDDWLELVDYGAMMRGFADLQEFDKAAGLQRVLYGGVNPSTGAFIKGLINTRLRRKQAESTDSEFAIRPLVRRHTNTQ